MHPGMFVVTEAEAAAIRAVFEQRGEFAAAVELRRRYPGVTNHPQAREYARTGARDRGSVRTKRTCKKCRGQVFSSRFSSLRKPNSCARQ